jgi:hypothetical protein
MKGSGVKYLKRLLQTIQKQKHQDFEVIISDHSDNNDLKNLVDEFKDSRFLHFFNSKNKGSSSSNLNNAIDLSNYEKIKPMFQDDFFVNDKELIITLLNQNNQLQTQIIELCKDKNITNINSCNNINSNNKTFNLNVFLNEYCKDAMNITDFVDSLKIQLSDLENVGEVGFINGISNIIVKNLKDLDVTQRPVHCTDPKREVLYVKDENKWEKEGETNVKLRKAIKRIAHKNSKMLSEFRKKHPDCGKSDSKYSDQYNKLVIEAMGGKGDNDSEKEDKIIKNIAKEVVIQKS